MEISTERQGNDTLIVRFQGEVNETVIIPVQNAFKQMLADETAIDHYMIDLSDVSFINSSGLGMFIMLQSKLRSKGKSLKVINIKPMIMEVFKAVCMDRYVTLIPANQP